MIDKYKSCENCSHLRHYVSEEKFLCSKGYFVIVSKQKFFYSPEKELADQFKDKEIFFLNKYRALSEAIECEEYDPIKYAVITDVDIEEVAVKNRGKYPAIIVKVLYVLSGKEKTINYENMSYGSKTRQYFIKVKNYIQIQKECNANICTHGYGE